jgi:hypothetical protein
MDAFNDHVAGKQQEPSSKVLSAITSWTGEADAQDRRIIPDANQNGGGTPKPPLHALEDAGLSERPDGPW